MSFRVERKEQGVDLGVWDGFKGVRPFSYKYFQFEIFVELNIWMRKKFPVKISHLREKLKTYDYPTKWL